MITIIIILGIMAVLFTISHFMVRLQPFVNPEDKEKNADHIFYYVKGNRILPDYTGVCFKPIDAMHFLTVQIGRNNMDKCIILCNIAFVWGKNKKC